MPGMRSAKRIGQKIGLLILLQLAGGLLVIFVLLRPLTTPPGFLEIAAASSLQLGVAVVLWFVVGALSIGIAIPRPPGLDPLPIAGTWVLFLLAFPFVEGGTSSMEMLIAGGVIGALITLGFMAVSRVRPTLDRRPSAQARFVLLAIGTGVAFGVWHVGSNWILAGLDADVRARLVERFVDRPDWGSTFAAAVVEEVVFRLFAFSVLAWLAFRLLRNRRVAFWVGLLVSSAIFAVPHLWGRPPGGEGLIAVAYQGLILLNSGLGGCLLGWVFWRWGLPQAMVCHFVIDAVVLLIGPLVLG